MSNRMCNQFTLHHEFRIDTGRTKFERKTDGILHACDPLNKRHKNPDTVDLKAPLCTEPADSVEETFKTLCIGSISNLLKRKDLTPSSKQDRTQSSFMTHSQLIVSRRLEKSFTRMYMRHPGLLQRFPLKTIGCRNWAQKLLDIMKTPNKSKHNQQIQLLEQGDLFRQNNRPVRVLRKSTNVFYLAAKAPMKEQGDLFIILCQCLLNV